MSKIRMFRDSGVEDTSSSVYRSFSLMRQGKFLEAQSMLSNAEPADAKYLQLEEQIRILVELCIHLESASGKLEGAEGSLFDPYARLINETLRKLQAM